MRVLLFSKYGRLGASSRLRTLQYLPLLRERGWTIDVSPLFSDAYVIAIYEKQRRWQLIVGGYIKRLFVLFTVWRYDVVWIEKELFPYLPAWGEWILAQLGVQYVVDFDDAVFHRYDNHKMYIIRLSLSHKIDKVMRNATAVVVGNSYLEKKACDAGASQIIVIPTVVDLDRYGEFKGQKDGPLTIGWIGSPGTSKYLLAISNALRKLVLEHKARIVVIGADPSHADAILAEHQAWREESEVNIIQTFDIGIMPIPDEAFERGKCGYKIIQYMACGLPLVASSVGVNTQIIENGVNGFLANSDADWYECMSNLLRDPALRKRMGKAGRNAVEKKYSLTIQSLVVAETLQHSVRKKRNY